MTLHPTTPFPKDRRVFIVDTNILFLWLSEAAGSPARDDYEERRRQRASFYFQDNRVPLIVPGLVAVELYGVFLQRDIDPYEYLLWRRKRDAALGPFEALLEHPKSHVRLGPLFDRDKQPFFDELLAIRMCRLDPSKKLQALWQEQAGKPHPDGSSRKIKGLDGMDSGVLSYAWCYALAHPFQEVRLLSDDRSLGLMIAELHHLGELSDLGGAIPPNLGSCHLFGKFYPPVLQTRPLSSLPVARPALLSPFLPAAPQASPPVVPQASASQASAPVSSQTSASATTSTPVSSQTSASATTSAPASATPQTSAPAAPKSRFFDPSEKVGPEIIRRPSAKERAALLQQSSPQTSIPSTPATPAAPKTSIPSTPTTPSAAPKASEPATSATPTAPKISEPATSATPTAPKISEPAASPAKDKQAPEPPEAKAPKRSKVPFRKSRPRKAASLSPRIPKPETPKP